VILLFFQANVAFGSAQLRKNNTTISTCW